MATHPSILAWRIPWTVEPGGLHTVYGSQRVKHNWGTKHEGCKIVLSWKQSKRGNNYWFYRCPHRKRCDSWRLRSALLPSAKQRLLLDVRVYSYLWGTQRVLTVLLWAFNLCAFQASGGTHRWLLHNIAPSVRLSIFNCSFPVSFSLTGKHTQVIHVTNNIRQGKVPNFAWFQLL